MGKQHEIIDVKTAGWIGRQVMFFVGTAPDQGGHVNVSPKGPIASLRVLDERTVAYIDVIGSGIETVAHLRQNGRICLMLCAFQGPPRIVRLHGRGEALMPGSPDYQEMVDGFDLDAIPGARESTRSVVRVHVERIADSCGYGVPLMEMRGERPQGAAWVRHMLEQGETALDDYAVEHNTTSIDGLPGLANQPRA